MADIAMHQIDRPIHRIPVAVVERQRGYVRPHQKQEAKRPTAPKPITKNRITPYAASLELDSCYATPGSSCVDTYDVYEKYNLGCGTCIFCAESASHTGPASCAAPR